MEISVPIWMWRQLVEAYIAALMSKLRNLLSPGSCSVLWQCLSSLYSHKCFLLSRGNTEAREPSWCVMDGAVLICGDSRHNTIWTPTTTHAQQQGRGVVFFRKNNQAKDSVGFVYLSYCLLFCLYWEVRATLPCCICWYLWVVLKQGGESNADIVTRNCTLTRARHRWSLTHQLIIIIRHKNRNWKVNWITFMAISVRTIR